MNGSSGEANEVVAKLHDEKLSSVKRRQKVFGSPVSTPTLKAAVAAGRVATSTGARIVREVEAALPKGDVPEAVIEEAKEEIDAKVAELTSRPKGKQKTRSTSTTNTEVPIIVEPLTNAPEEVEATDGAGQAVSCPRNPLAIRSAVLAILTATRTLREQLPNLHPKRLDRILGETIEDGGTEGENHIALQLLGEDLGAGLALATLMKAPPEGTHTKVDALRQKLRRYMEEGRRTDIVWGHTRSEEILVARIGIET